MSDCRESEIDMASRRPSGENRGKPKVEGADRNGDITPPSASHMAGDCCCWPKPPGWYARTPVFEIVKLPSAATGAWNTPSTTGTGSPRVERLSRSNGAANNVPLRTNV